MKKLICLLSASLLFGCATKTRSVELDGMYAQAETATVAIGSVDVIAAPVGEETATIKYEEDTSWMNTNVKTHSIRIMLTGTNSVSCSTQIIDSICKAFTLSCGTNRVGVLEL